MNRRAIIYKSAAGKEPYPDYIQTLRDRYGAAKILARVARAEQGNLGDHRGVGHGVIELRIHYGPGYRVYVGLDGLDVIVLLGAGDKSSQQKDIRQAQIYWEDYRDRR